MPHKKKPLVVVTRKLPEAVETRMRELFDARLNLDDQPMSREALIEAVQTADVLVPTVTDEITAEIIAAAGDQLKLIANFGNGFDNIDVTAAAARSIDVTNTPGVLTDDTADMTMALIMAVARRIPEGARLVPDDKWQGWSPTWMLGTRITGKRLGIIGMGRIGQAVAARARAFGMAIHYHSRRPVAAEDAQGAIHHARFEDLLPKCDFLSINCASTPETRGMVNAAALALLPAGAIVINTARGDIVDDNSLIAALASGRVAAAGLDVFKGEPNIDPRYRTLDNVFMLPHIGSATPATRSAMGHKCIDNLVQFFDGERPTDLLTA